MKKKIVFNDQEYVLFKVNKSNEGIPGAEQTEKGRGQAMETNMLTDKPAIADDGMPSPNNMVRSFTE